MNSIGSISHAVAFLAFFGLTAVLVVSRRKNERSGSLILASGLSAVWAMVATFQATNPALFWAFGGALDSIRILAWAFFLHSVLGSSTSNQPTDSREQTTSLPSIDDTGIAAFRASIFPGVVLCVITAHLGLWWVSVTASLPLQIAVRIMATLWILSSMTAMLSLERFIRSTPPERRPAIRYMTIGLGTMFLFDFIIFTDAQLFSRINTNLWFARGFAYALVVPLIALAVARNPQWSVTLHVSRHAVTSSMTALAAGGYLLITAIAAYFVRFSGVEWASVAEVVVILTALVLLALLILSGTLRSRMRVFVSKHLFNFKYDYRHEWLNFTDTLASQIGDTPQAVLLGLSQLVNSAGGVMWCTTKSGRVEIIAGKGKLDVVGVGTTDAAALQNFMERTLWLIDLDEVREHPERYEGMQLSTKLQNNLDAWLVLPLMFKKELVACLIIERSAVYHDINWEDRDLLKTAGRQAATLLKHEQTQAKLHEASQFQAFSKLSAYIVHDLKNIIGQQSLLVSNAARHKHNPEFVDDVITTVDNSVKRMQALLEQLRANRVDEHMSSIDVVNTLEAIVARRSDLAPKPVMEPCNAQFWVYAEPDRLKRVFGHLLQNAQEATPTYGSVSVSIAPSNGSVTVTVSDTGSGMTQDFMKNSLFKAFESTKGLTGMGIGAFESREYINSLGGEITVISEPGKGSQFCVQLPLVNTAEQYVGKD